MRIDFDDESSIEVQQSKNSENVFIIIKAKDYENTLRKIVNSVEISKDQLKKLVSEFL